MGYSNVVCKTSTAGVPNVEVTDELSFDFAPVKGFDVRGSWVTTASAASAAVSLGQIALCQPDACGTQASACIVAGSATTGGTIRLFHRAPFRPVQEYKVSVRPPVTTGSTDPLGDESRQSNELGGSTVRVPGTSNDRPWILGLRSASFYGIASYYHPKEFAPSAVYGNGSTTSPIRSTPISFNGSRPLTRSG